MWILVAQDIGIIDLLNCNLWHMVWYCVSHSHIVEGWKTQKYGWLQLQSEMQDHIGVDLSETFEYME